MTASIECPCCLEPIELEDAMTPSNVAAAPGVAYAMGLPPEALLSIHAGQAAHRNERTIEDHLKKHTVLEWVTRIQQLRSLYDGALGLLDLAASRVTNRLTEFTGIPSVPREKLRQEASAMSKNAAKYRAGDFGPR